MFVRFIFLTLVAVKLHASDAPPWRPFNADSPWNRKIPTSAPGDRDSARLIADFASRGPLHINLKTWSISVCFVNAEKPPDCDRT